MKIYATLGELRSEIAKVREAGQSVGFVPTMGYLHPGHISLVEQAERLCDLVVVSIFVNPTQFNDPKDFQGYPIDLQRDQQLLEQAGADILFLPAVEEIYGKNFQSWVTLEQLPKQHCGEFRPGHFRGVATVVSILFNMVQPDLALFGEKDFQQVRVIEQMVSDLKFPIRVIRGETVRESDGLAMSSRNVRLSEAARKTAPAIYRALNAAQQLYSSGERLSARIQEVVAAELKTAPEIKVQYINVIAEEDLLIHDEIRSPSRVLFAGTLDGVRLIDNVALR